MATIDTTPYVCIPAALAYREALGGEKAIRDYNTQLARAAGKRVAEIFGTEVLENSTGTLGNCCMTNVRLPLDPAVVEEVAIKGGIDKDDVVTVVRDWVLPMLLKESKTYLFVQYVEGAWWVRFSGQVYLELEDFEWAAQVLKEMCGRLEKGEFLQIKSQL